ncbi:MAG TPA: hypothetical protein VGE50_02455 [Gammaproteobacteria bacterium]
MAPSTPTPNLGLPALVLWLATFLGAIVSTHLLRDAHTLLGWNYLVLFLLAGTASTLGRGIYRWVVAAWGGALLMLLVETVRGQLPIPPGLPAVQYLPAALTGALLGEWLRYRRRRWLGQPFSPLPSLHLLVVTAIVLVLLPLLAFLYSAEHTLAGVNWRALLMFTPGNTPFLFPSLISAALCGYWVGTPAAGASQRERRVAQGVMGIAIALMLLALAAKFIFGVIEVA